MPETLSLQGQANICWLSGLLNSVHERDFFFRRKSDFLLSHPNLKLLEQAPCPICFTGKEHWPPVHTLPHLGHKKLVRRPGTGTYLGTLTRPEKDRNLVETNLPHWEGGREEQAGRAVCLPHPTGGNQGGTSRLALVLESYQWHQPGR